MRKTYAPLPALAVRWTSSAAFAFAALAAFALLSLFALLTLEQLWETTMNPETRTLKCVTIDSAAEADRVFSMLMGDEVATRREFIESHAKYARLDV